MSADQLVIGQGPLMTFHVEVARDPKSREKRSCVESLIAKAFSKEDKTVLEDHFDLEQFILRHPDLKGLIRSLKVYKEHKIAGGGIKNGSHQLMLHNGSEMCNGHAIFSEDFQIHVYDLNEDGEEAEYMDDDEEDGDGQGGTAAAASHHWVLPSQSFDGLWDSLLFEHAVQSRLLKYINSALLFAEKGVDTNLISWNKVILLHGPPGTGKTSLCKALAQKATIRLCHRYLYGQLVEINSHSLFSKWFSESGKLVMKMFEKIHELVEDPKCLVFLLIDEVESLAQCRQSAEAGNEPTDSIRAVNALLTQIDRIKRFPNVVILTTSNIVGSIDLAFVDRADLKIFIGPPPTEIIYGILASSTNELIRVGIITSDQLFPTKYSAIISSNQEASKLVNVSKLAFGMSGRTLRKLPFLAHANFMNSENCDLDNFLNCLEQAVEMEVKEAYALKRQQ